MKDTSVREALKKLIGLKLNYLALKVLDRIAPVIEKALRAAYKSGWRSHYTSDGKRENSDNGVIDGIAAMMEEL